MKQCPVCKTTYTDDTLAFCLSDGTSLVAVQDSQATQQMSFDRNQMRVEIPSSPSNPTIISKPRTIETKKSNGKGLMIVLLTAGLLLLGIAAIAGVILYNNGNFGKTDTALNNSSTPAQTPTPSKTEENTQELKERLANVEKQLSEQKNAKTNSNQIPITKPTQPDSTPANPTQTNVTAKVAPSGDGYLALRSAPSSQNGTQILKIPSGSVVELQDCQRNYSVVDNRRGRWCMISYGGNTGWAFDAWLIY